MKILRIALCVFCCIVVLSACHKKKNDNVYDIPDDEPYGGSDVNGDGDQAEAVLEERVSKEISAEKGGTVTNSDGSVSIEIPGDALDEDTTITMNIYGVGRYHGSDADNLVSKIVEFGPTGIIFKKPVIISMEAQEDIDDKILVAAVFNEIDKTWSYSEHAQYAVLGTNEAGDPIMTTAAGDPIMLNAAGDPIMQNAAGDPIMMAAAGDPIMLASAGDPIMTSAAGDPIMNAAAGDPIMMTTGHFTAYSFFALEPEGEVEHYETELREVYSKVLCTGQNKCYDNGGAIACPNDGGEFFGQDAQYAALGECTPHSLSVETVSDESIVVDNITGLQWQQAFPEETFTWKNAVSYCENLSYAGYEDWRLPDTAEIFTVSDLGLFGPAFDTTYFPNITDSASSGFWTSQERKADPMKAYFVYHYDSYSDYETKTATYNVMCVRGAKLAAADFTLAKINGDIVVTDLANGLYWQKTYQTATWRDALSYCENLSYAGLSDWRLPSRNELSTLFNYDKSGGAYSDFPGMPGDDYFWSSSTASFDSGFAWLAHFGYGYMYYSEKPGAHLVRCVRGGKEKPNTISFPYTDPETNLTWSAKADSIMNWNDAGSYCENLTDGGYSDWYLPGIDELRTLLINADRVKNNCRVSEAGDCLSYNDCWSCSTCTQTGVQETDGNNCTDWGEEYGDGRYSKIGDTGYFWSSATDTSGPAGAWGIYFYNANVYGAPKTGSGYVRCVRSDSQSGSERESSCTGLPANAQWNTASTITQTLEGEEWVPSTAGVYNEEPSSTECRFKCVENYEWNGSACVEILIDPCDPNPCTGAANSTGVCTTEGGSYSCGCLENYEWDAFWGLCAAEERTSNCTGLPSNAEWNTASTITQTWSGSSWLPAATGVYNETASTAECRFKCVSGYSWDGTQCAANSSGASMSLGNICTNHTSCYNASSSMTCPTSSSADFYGQDAQYTDKCTAQSFTSSTNVVVDNNTGLTWEKSPSSDTYTWDDAQNHCNDLNTSNYGGKNNWRVPNPLEFMTIVDNSRYNPATNSNFTGMPTSDSTYLWTSKEYKGDANNAYHFSPSYGWYRHSGAKTSAYKVLCVSGNEMQPAVSANFTTQTINGAEVVTDSATGLMWQKEYETKSWQEALKYCEDLTYAGYTDWRLPNKNELVSLVNYEKSEAPYSYFPDMPNTFFWSSTTTVDDKSKAWGVSFYYGAMTNYGKSYDAPGARCVRSGEESPTDPCTPNPCTGVANSTGVCSTEGGSYSCGCNENYEWNGSACVVDPMNPPECSPTSGTPCMDSESTLTWSAKSSIDMGRDDAVSYCENLTEGGYTDWYLPDIDELMTLLINADRIKNNCQISEAGNCLSYNDCWSCSTCTQEGTQSSSGNGCSSYGTTYSDGRYSKFGDTNYFWSSSTRSDNTDNAWHVAFGRGSVGNSSKSDNGYVRCVRSGDEPESDPCDPNPCTGIANSTGVCTGEGGSYSCGCADGYFWNGSQCIVPLGKICTNQTKCYNNNSGETITCPTSSSADFYGQDAQYTDKCTAQSFSSTSNVVVDNNTGLTWEKSPSSDTYTWDDAQNHCNDLNTSNYGGKSNWRVPNPLELLTIIDNNTYNPATNSNFTGMPTSTRTYFWTSKEYKGDTSYAYAFKPYYGNNLVSVSEAYLKTETYKVLCVSGTEMQSATSSNFATQTISGADVVTDSATGLMWQKEFTADKTWQQALKYCEDSTYAGYSDWRLPNKNELASLLNYEKPGYPYSYFPDMPSDYFWSSTTCVSLTNIPWLVGFSLASVDGSDYKNGSNYVRCVRSGEESPTDPCNPNPCTGVANSTGVCSTEGGSYSCGCADGYFWDGTQCAANSSGASISLGKICTNQTTCYDASSSMTCPTSSSADFYGQDAQYTDKCTAQSFTSSTNVVIDNNTGLTWEKSPSESTYTWDDAPNHCVDLNTSNYGGKNNWRVPNPLELLTIVDNSRYNPATNSNFTNMPTDSSVWIWTSKEYKGNTSYAYRFSPYYGNYYGYDSDEYSKTKTYKVLCVSGNEMLPATFSNFTTQTISGKVVVTDSKTGLMWQKEYETSKTWQQALSYCEDLTYAGYTDWRLPNKNELASLVNYEKPEAPYSYFPDMPDSYFWSSSTRVYLTNYAWGVDFYRGGVGYDVKTDNYRVRCVRSGDEPPTDPCTPNPCTGIANSTGVCSTEGGSYSCGCVDGYFWDGTQCAANSSPSLPECSPTSGTPCIDSESTLTWSAKSSSSMVWENAGSYCENLTEGGYTDWRLPNIDELRTLIQECAATEPGGACGVTESCLSSSDCWSSDACDSCSYDSTGGHCKFGDTNYLWSSSTVSDNPDYAWYVSFEFGYVYHYYKSNNNYVRCVRSGDEPEPDPCNPNPCTGVANSTGVCTGEEGGYSCGCADGYFWNGSQCKLPLVLGKICTNQTSCYNDNSGETIACPTSSSADFYGQDAQYRSKCTAQSFSSTTNVVIDNNTGLTWEKSPSENTYTWDDAPNHCAELNSSNYAGINNWRVPNPLEFMTIVDNSTYAPATNSNFTNMSTDSTYFWTSKEYKGNTNSAYYFSPSYGWYNYSGKTNTYKVLCVSGNEMQPATSSNFTTETISGSVVVTDSNTSLMWQKEYETSKTWQAALSYCESLTYAGYSDWRLPNKNELASLVNYEKSGSPYSYFPGMPSSWFWSSSTRSAGSNHAWYVDFINGYVNYYNKSLNYYVRCVR